MSESIKPALTPEEWARMEAAGDAKRNHRFWLYDAEGEHWSEAGNAHGIAALALHGQPFGFTWADVDALRESVDFTRRGAVLEDLADRIAALLPPRP